MKILRCDICKRDISAVEKNFTFSLDNNDSEDPCYIVREDVCFTCYLKIEKAIKDIENQP